MLKLHPSPRRLVLLVVLALSVILNAWLLVQWRTVPSEAVAEIRKSEQYPLLAKRIFVTNQNDLLINFVGLRQQLRQYVEAQPEQLGVYFEYLPSGVSIGLNEKENYLLIADQRPGFLPGNPHLDCHCHLFDGRGDNRGCCQAGTQL